MRTADQKAFVCPPNARPSWTSCGNFLLGSIIALIVGTKYALYVRELHENDMWFSDIGVSKETLNTHILIMLNVVCVGRFFSLYFLVCINYQGTVLSNVFNIRHNFEGVGTVVRRE